MAGVLNAAAPERPDHAIPIWSWDNIPALTPQAERRVRRGEQLNVSVFHSIFSSLAKSLGVSGVTFMLQDRPDSTIWTISYALELKRDEVRISQKEVEEYSQLHSVYARETCFAFLTSSGNPISKEIEGEHVGYFQGISIVTPGRPVLGAVGLWSSAPISEMVGMRNILMPALYRIQRAHLDRLIESNIVSRSDFHTKQARLMRTVMSVQSAIMLDKDRTGLFMDLLAELLTVSNSFYGLIGEVLETEDKHPFAAVWACTDISWTPGTQKAFYSGMRIYKEVSLYGPVLHGHIVISNDVEHDPRASGRPVGHPLLESFLGIPIKRNSKVIGIVGFSNKPGGFAEEDVLLLEPLLAAYGVIIEANEMAKHRKQAEAAVLAARKEAESANAIKTKILTGISHEFKTPLNAILGIADLMIHTPPNATEVKAYSTTIEQCASSLLQTIDQLLDYAAVQTGALALSQNRIDVRETVEAVARFVALTALERGVGLVIQLQPEVESASPLLGDPDKLRKILQNLLRCAIHYCVPKGTVSVAAQLFPWKPTSITNTPQSVKDVNSSHSSYGEEGTPVPLPWKESQASSIRLPTNHLPVTRVSSADSCPFSQRASSSSSSASAYLPFSQPSLFHEVALQCTMTTSPTAVPIAQIAEALSPLPPPADAAMEIDGLALGLSNTRDLVTIMGGMISINGNADPNQNAVSLTVEIPLARLPSSSLRTTANLHGVSLSAPLPPLSPRFGNTTLSSPISGKHQTSSKTTTAGAAMVIDPILPHRHATVEMMKPYFAVIDEVNDLEEALKRCRKRKSDPFSLIVVDGDGSENHLRQIVKRKSEMASTNCTFLLTRTLITSDPIEREFDVVLQKPILSHTLAPILRAGSQRSSSQTAAFSAAVSVQKLAAGSSPSAAATKESVTTVSSSDSSSSSSSRSPLSPRVLIVDDNQMNRLVITKLLKQLCANSVEIDYACDGEEAVKQFSSGSHALVLMDLHMPVMDGYEATKRIIAMNPKAEVVAVTASLREDSAKCAQVGMRAFIQKPVSKLALREVMARMDLPGVEITS